MLRPKGSQTVFRSALETGLTLFFLGLGLMALLLHRDEVLARPVRTSKTPGGVYSNLRIIYSEGPMKLLPESSQGYPAQPPEEAIGLVSLLRGLRRGNGRILMLGAGNFLDSRVAWSAHDQGRSDFDLIRLSGFDALLPGPGEFGLGLEILQKARQQGLPLICANLVEPMSQQSAFTPFMLFNYEKFRVAVTGVVDPSCLLDLPQGVLGGVQVIDPCTAVRKVLYQLRNSEVNMTILLAVGNMPAIRDIAQSLRGRIDYLVTALPDLQSETPILDTGVPILCIPSAGLVGAMELTLRDGRPVQVTTSNLHFEQSSLSGGGSVGHDLESDTVIDQAVKRIFALHWTRFRSFLSSSLTYVFRPRGREIEKNSQSPASEVVSSALLQGSHCQIAAWPAAILKGYFWKGHFQEHDLIRAIPGDRYLWLLRVSGEDMEETMLRSCDLLEKGSGHLFFGGLEFTTFGNVVRDPLVNGFPLDRTATYLVVVPEPELKEQMAYPELYRSTRVQVSPITLRRMVASFLLRGGEL
jgi:hypothetical protein